METYESEQVIRGHHIYQSVWTPFIGEELVCQKESANRSDPFAVAVLKPDSTSDSSMVVGHVPRKISAACSVFLEFGGVIRCTITGPRQYSRDLRQGGLDVPCKITFIGENPHLSNVAKLIKRFEMKKRKFDGEHSDKEETHPSKKEKDDSQDDSIQEIICVKDLPTDSEELQPAEQWVSFNRKMLSIVDRETIVKGL